MNLGMEIGNGVVNFFTGYGMGLSDRLFSENAKRFKSTERTKRKFDRVQALSYLAEQGDVIPEDASEYSKNMLLARAYFESRGLQRSRRALGQIVEKVTNYSNSPELINNLKAGSTLALATGIELSIDGMVLVSETLSGYGHIGKAFGRSFIYQIPCLFAGMEAAKATLWFKDLGRTREEKDIDRLAKELTSDGKLYQIVKNYSLTGRVKVDSRVVDKSQEPQTSDGAQTALGERIGTKIADTAEGIEKNIGSGIKAIRERMEQRRKVRDEKEEQAREDQRRRTDDAFKNY